MTDSQQADLQKFLFDFVESLEDLLILAWFQSLDQGTLATASEVAQATGVTELIASDVLERLTSKGLLAMTAAPLARFRYAPPNQEFSATLDLVLERYQASPMDVLRIMSANSIERVRATLRTLAETLRGGGPKRD